MSRGPGRCQRRIIDLLQRAPKHRLTRAELEETLVKREGYNSSNLLRAVKCLARDGCVIFRDERHKQNSIVALPQEVERVPESKVMALLAEIEGSS